MFAPTSVLVATSTARRAAAGVFDVAVSDVELAALSAAELGGEIDEAVGDHIEIVLGLDIPGLVRAVLERPADKGGVEAATARRHQIAIVRRDHHALLGLQIEKRGGPVVGFRLRLVGMGDFGAEDGGPPQAGG